MIELLKTDFPCHYGLHRLKVNVISDQTSNLQFDLTDNSEAMIVAFREGNVSFNRTGKQTVEVINYEDYIKEFCGTSFERGRKRCDCLLYDKEEDSNKFFLLNEQTSVLNDVATLSKPILDKNHNVVFNGGKYEKVEIQLLETLKTLMAVTSIKEFINKHEHKICLMSYTLNERTSRQKPNALLAFLFRYKKVESQATRENGAILHSSKMNEYNFEYRRICHDFVFNLD